MFEGLIEQLLLAYLGDYIENLDKDKLSLGIWSGSLILENILIRVQSINALKLPFKMLLGRIDKLNLCISWKTNFSEPTQIVIDGVSIVLSLLKPSEWEILDYISYESKLSQIMKYANNKYYQLVNLFNSDGKQEGYMSRVLWKILDNLQVTFKNINIRIEECSNQPFYSFGLTLKEIVVINTNETWEQTFIDRNKEKTATVFKLLKIFNFGLYLTVNEQNLISAIPEINDRYDKMNQLFPSNCDYAKDVKYLIKPMSLVAKMKQLHQDTIITLKDKADNPPLLSILIDLDSFNVELQKEEFDCFIYILNHISKYQKYQSEHYETRKFNFFKPKNKIFDKERMNIIKSQTVKNENAVLWLKFGIDMILRQIKYYKGNRDIFQIPQFHLRLYQEKYTMLFEQVFKNKIGELNAKEKEAFKSIVTNVDIKILQKWTEALVQNFFKNEKIEEKKNSQKGYLSYLFSWGYSQSEESLKKLSEEEEKKIVQFIESASNSLKTSFEAEPNSTQVKISLDFSMNEGSVRFLTKKQTKNADVVEGFEVKYQSIQLEFSQSNACIQIESSLQTFHVDMFTIINKNTNHIPITFRSITSEDFKLSSSVLTTGNDGLKSAVSSSSINLNNTSLISNSESEIKSIAMKDNPYLIKVKFQYTPSKDINTTFWLHMTDLNMTYHQVFLDRVIMFFKIHLNEELTNKAWDGYAMIKKTTKQTIQTNIYKRNIFKVQIDPRKIVIPINKFDIKNSKVLLLEIGNVVMNTSDQNNELKIMTPEQTVIDSKYSRRYDFFLDSLSLSYYASIKLMQQNKNRFEIITDVSGKMGFALLKDMSLNHEYPSVKLFFEVENITINLTEYLYIIFIYLTEIVKPTFEKDIWSQLTLNKKEIARNLKVTAGVLKKNWISNTWEKLFAIISGGYIYFYKSPEDEDYSGYFYLKDGQIKVSSETNIIKIENLLGTIELKFPNDSKLKQWELCLSERIEEMKTSTEEKNEEAGKELKKIKKDPLEIYFGGEITLKQITLFLFHQTQDNYDNIFKISVNYLCVNMLLRFNDTKTNLSIQGVKIFDMCTNTEAFKEIINSEDVNDKETKLFNMNIILCEESSPIYNNVQIDVDLNIGYLYVIWNPVVLRKLLFFLVHNDKLKKKVKRDIINPNEKLVEEKFIEPSLDNIASYPTCTETKYIYLKIKGAFKKISIILIQPIMSIMYHQMCFCESNLHCEMTVDHFEIKGELGNTQVFDLCEYPFIIQSQDKFDKNNMREIFGVKDDKSLIAFYYRNVFKWCPLYKDNYSSEANVKINSTSFVYVQEQFLRFLNFFLKEFLGAMGPETTVQTENGKIDQTPDPKEMQFFKLNVVINNPLIILKPRIYFDDYFIIDLGKLNITCFYNKVYGKLRKNPEDWRWLTTYHIALNDFMIRTQDNFQVCSPTNGILNMHFTSFGEKDQLLSPIEFDFSYQFDIFFNEFIMNMRQKDLTLLLKCLDLNILYTDYKVDEFNFTQQAKDDQLKSASSVGLNDQLKSSSISLKEDQVVNEGMDDITKAELMSKYIYMFSMMFISKIKINLFIEKAKGPFAQIALQDTSISFTNKLDFTKQMTCNVGHLEIYHFNDKNEKEIIISDFSQLIHEYEQYDKQKGNKEAFLFASKDEDEEIQMKKPNNALLTERILKNIESCVQLTLINTEQSSLTQVKIEIAIDKDRNKNYTIILESLKFLIRLDTTQLINTFFLEAFPYYDKSFKDLPNLYDENEDNYPRMIMMIEIRRPLISFLSDSIENKDQEMYCIRSDVTVHLQKQKTNEIKECMINSYRMIQSKYNKLTEETAKSDLEKMITNYKINTWKLKSSLNINPFICTMREVLGNEKLVISSRRIMNDFQMKYVSKIQMSYDFEKKIFITEAKYSFKTGKIVANLSFKDLLLLMKVSSYNQSLMSAEFTKNYESLIFFSKEKGYYVKKREREEKEEKEKIEQEEERMKDYEGNKKLAEKEMENISQEDKDKDKKDNNKNNGYEKMIEEEEKPQPMLIDLLIEKQKEIEKKKKSERKIFNKDVKISISHKAIDTGKVTSINQFEGISVFLIDNHASTYFPFLNIQLSRMNSSSVYFKTKNICVTYNITMMILNYNNLAGVWEYLLENTDMKLETDNYTTEDKCSTFKYVFEISNSENNVVNINISDLSLVFLYSIFSSWQMKYDSITKANKLKGGRIDESLFEPDEEKKMKVSNHTLLNYTGKTLILFHNSSDNSFTKKIGEIKPNEHYEIEYPTKTIFHHDIEQKNKSESKIKVEIEKGIIEDNELNIDKVQQKDHKVQYHNSDLDRETVKYIFIVSKVVLYKMRKYIYFYSPLSFQNKTQYTFFIKLSKKDKSEILNLELDQKKTIGVPFEYLTGEIEINLNKTVYIFPLIKFLTSKEIKKELNFNNTFVHFYHQKGEIPRNKAIQIRTCYTLRNCLPFTIEISIKGGNKKEEVIKIEKGDRYSCDSISMGIDFNISISFLNFTTKSEVTLYSLKKVNKVTDEIKVYTKNNEEASILRTIFKSNKITVVLYPNKVLINHASTNTRFFYGKNNKTERGISGRTDASNIFLLISEEQYMHIQYAQYISSFIHLESINTTTVIECKKKSKKKFIEFLMDSQLSLAANDLDLYCNIITFKPKYVIWNCLVYPIQITNEVNEKELILRPNEKNPFYFFGIGDKINLVFAIQGNDNWNKTNPIQLNNNDTLLTISMLNEKKTKRFFMNIERLVDGLVTYFKISQSKTETATVSIVNQSNYICSKAFQKECENDSFIYNIRSKGIFAWENPTKDNIICFSFGFGSLQSRPIMKVHTSCYEIQEDKVVIHQSTFKTAQQYPLVEVLRIERGVKKYQGYSIKLTIQTDGIKIKIIIEDITVDKTALLYPISQTLNFNLIIKQLGLSLIGDNAFIECKNNYDYYDRKEIAYFLIKGIKVEMKTDQINDLTKINLKVRVERFEVDNEMTYNTHFPLLVSPINNQKHGEQKDKFLQFKVKLEKEENEQTTKCLLVNYRVEPFALKIESNIVNGFWLFALNLTTGMKTSFTYVHPIFLPFDVNLRNGLMVKEDYFDPTWTKVSDIKEIPNIFIQKLDLSQIDIVFSFLNQSKDKIFDKILETNPILSRVLTTISNIENTSLRLNGCIRQNISGQLSVIIINILRIYQQNAMNQIMKLFASIEIFGTPMNLFQSLGTGVKDFFEKPIEGMKQGAVEGAKGIVKGSVSLFKNTVDGAFNTTSKISSGLSRGILYVTQDDEYINKREKKKMTEKAHTIVEGIGYGLTSMANGLFEGVTDLVRKPIEGAKKENLKGFGKGLLKGFSGALVKPVSGVLDLVSKTSEGLQNTFKGEKIIKMAREPRPFYGKFKYIKLYNENDARILYFINTQIPHFQKNPICFVSAIYYSKKDNTQNLLVFSTKSVYLINSKGLELEVVLNYSHIKNVIKESELKIKIIFHTLVNNKKSVSISFSKTQSKAQKVFQMFQDAMNANFQP